MLGLDAIVIAPVRKKYLENVPNPTMAKTQEYVFLDVVDFFSSIYLANKSVDLWHSTAFQFVYFPAICLMQ